jgi:hypothetical protein
MELSGKIIVALPIQSGTSPRTGNQWSSQSYVLETKDQFPKKVPFEVFGEDRIKKFDIKVGDEVTIQFDIEGSEYNGRWYARVKCYGVKKEGLFGQQQQPAPTQTVIYPDRQQQTPPPTQEDLGDSLPF